MKKLYIEPKMMSHKIKMNTILCGSMSGDGLNMSIKSEGASSDGDSRSFSFGDEE